MKAYIAGMRTGGAVLSECQEIPARDRAGEYLMLRMRTAYGVEEEEYVKNYLLPFEPLEAILQNYAKQGLAMQDEGRWRLTARGFLVSNAILVELLEAQEQSAPLAKRRK